MSVEQFRIYNTFNSQYLRLVREPNLFTMPRTTAPAIDAGCYVGYKALAMAQFVDGCEVLAFELASDNYDVLRLNIANNPKSNVTPIRAALSDQRVNMSVNTRNERTMAHSLNVFSSLKEQNTSLLTNDESNRITDTVKTDLLDDYTDGMEALSAVHISVNGHEPEVVRGGNRTAAKTEILRISCPYKRDDRMVRDLVIQELTAQGVEVFGISGAAVIAGREQGDYHARSV